MDENNNQSRAMPNAGAGVVERLAAGIPVLALGVRISRTPDIARLAKASGHHVIWVDLEHSSISIDAATQICAAALDIGLTPFVRIPEREYGVIGRLLDGGAVGIMAPRVETAAQARDLVEACRFPPFGHRSAIGTLPHVGYQKMQAAGFNEAMNRLTVLKVLIESPLGIRNIAEIAAVPGVDMLGIGTNDLTAEMSLAGQHQHASVREAHEEAIAAAKKAGKPLMIGGIPDAAYSAELIRKGAAPFLMTGIDTDMLLSVAQTRVKQALESINHSSIMTHEILTSTPTRDASSLSRPTFSVPAGACDSHVHVFESGDIYPHVDKPHYTLPDGPLAKLNQMADFLGLAHYVIVQSSFYGTDNRCLLDALDKAGPRARGVAMVDETVTDAELQHMHHRGVRALRLDLFLRAALPTSQIVQYIERSANRVKALGWHLQFYTPGKVVRDLIPFLAHLDADFVIDHMGYMLESDGLTRQDFDRLLSVLKEGRGWMKLSGPYRLAKDGNYERLRPLARAIVGELPDRVIWGSDWPHIPDGGRDTGALLNLLADWIPEEDDRRKILSDNPAHLFGFGQ